MAVTLAEAKNSVQNAYDAVAIDEFRKSTALLDALVFDDAVNPAGGGATMTYGYRRLVTNRDAAFRQLNTEYTPATVETSQHSVNLAVLGGSFEIDRVIARMGAPAANAINLNTTQLIKATKAKFTDAVINGDTTVEVNGFDGLDKALTGSSTEYNTSAVADWTALDTVEKRLAALDQLDEFLSLLDGTPSLVIGNTQMMAKIRSIVRGTGMYVREPIDGLIGQDGRPIERETYGGVTFVDAGAKAGSNDPIVKFGTSATAGQTSLYAVRIGLDGFHGVTTVGSQMAMVHLPNFSDSGAVKKGEVELGPVAVALKATKAAAVFRKIKVK